MTFAAAAAVGCGAAATAAAATAAAAAAAQAGDGVAGSARTPLYTGGAVPRRGPPSGSVGP